jgi:CRISPR-associated protein Cmr2
MEKLEFWKQKIVQAFHDPPGKPYAFFPGTGGHKRLAERLFKHFTGEDLKYYAPRPDLAASGADRPVLSRPRGQKGQYGLVPFHGDGNNVVAHPLAGGFWLRLTESRNAQPLTLDDVEKLLAQQEEALDKLGQEDASPTIDKEYFQGAGPVDWNDPDALQKGFWVIWRRFRDELAAAHPAERLLWERIPGDSRIPDHSIWEHLKMASALAFLNAATKVPEEKEPWLFSYALTPVQGFIEESRTSRDLWVSSFLIADLAWHAMLPIVKHYGPDCIVYPDLRENPRVDNWLYHNHRQWLAEDFGYPVTYAAVLPHTFTAILPGGGKEHLLAIREMARRCEESARERWHELENQVQAWFSQQTNTSSWNQIWERQHQAVLTSYWTAVQWQVPIKIENEEELKRLTLGGALPAQDRALLPAASPETREAAERRAARLSVWTPRNVWGHYERARAVFGRVNLGYVQNERGFDYALTHHELRVRQRMRKQEARYGPAADEPGEKCTVCRTREALHNVDQFPEGIDARRARVRDFWSKVWTDRGEADTTDRLCAVCAFKRFLIDAGGPTGGINPIFYSPTEAEEAGAGNVGGRVLVPFPSTSAIAAQKFLAAVATSSDPDVQRAMSRAFNAHRAAGLQRTLFPRTLPRLLDASRSSSQPRFLEIDPQESIFAEAVQTLVDRAGKGNRKDRLGHLLSAVKELRSAASRAKISPPDTHIAVLKLDGDHIGRLLLGDAGRVGTTWRDVIHPRVVEKIEQISEMKEAGWAGLLDSPRLMGPSLHAFISRALADFSHRIVPWVVEQEYGGRLIYAGGDDVLAIAPAQDALPIAARLQQLFAAAWIIDTRPEVTAWSWRSGTDGGFNPAQARLRFLIPKRLDGTATGQGRLPAIELPLGPEDLEPPVGGEQTVLAPDQTNCRVLAGLGSRQSLSASIVYGHFKTDLSLLLREGRRLLDVTAKERAERGAVALSHRSRGGSKSEIALRWSIPNQAGEPEWKAEKVIEAVVDAFREKRLPGRLPYKLRTVAPLLLVESDPEDRKKLANGLVRQALERDVGKDLTSAVLILWLQGYKLNIEWPDARGLPSGIEETRAVERSVDGLLLCRYLAGQGVEGD